jgi:SHS2 domain-containing protein
MDAGYELFDHTADLGVRAWAPDLVELVRVAGQGFYAVIGELTAEGAPRTERFEIAGPELPVLLRDYLAELLLLFERDFRMVTVVEVEAFEPGRLVVAADSQVVSRERSALDREVKAITYHGLDLQQVEGGYEVTYIVDI